MRQITENITKVTYEGNCPTCGKLQTSLRKSDTVDAICFECMIAARQTTTEKSLLDAKVIDMRFNEEGWLSAVIMRTKSGKDIFVSSMHYSTVLLYYEVENE